MALVAYQRSSYLGTIDNELTDTGAALAVLPSMFWVSKYTNLQIGWQYVERKAENSAIASAKRSGPFFMLGHANYSRSGAQISPESGGGAYLGAYKFLLQDGYLDHSQFLAGGEVYLSRYLPRHHALMLRVNGVYTPEDIRSIYGVATDSIVFIPDSPLPQYILRGYRRGQLYGRNLVSANIEYRFPFSELDKGWGTKPLYLRRLSGALVGDGAAADGIFIDDVTFMPKATDMKRSYWSAGTELKLETTVGYVIPVTMIVGYYVAFNSANGPEGIIASTFQIVGF